MRWKLSTLTVWFALTCVSLAVNFAAQWRSEHAVNFVSEAARVSWALQHQRGFADPYLSGPSGPTAQMAPVYPFVHAAICVVFGTGAAGWAAIVALTSLVWSLQWTLGYDFLRFYGYPKAGLGAALFGVLLPLPGRLFKWEAVFTGCALAAGACVMARLLEKPERGKAILLGVCAAICALLAPATAVVFFAWAAIFLKRGPVRSAMKLLAIAGVCAILPIGAWTVRNYQTFGELFFIRDDTGMAIGSSNADCTKAVLAENLASGCFATLHPTANGALLEELKQQGEVLFARRQMAATREWIRAHPKRFMTLTLERFAYFWFPVEINDKRTLVTGIFMSLVTVLSLLSILWRGSPGFSILAAALLCYPAAYYLVQVEQRYRYPVYWMSVLLAGAGIELALRRRAVRTSSNLILDGDQVVASGDLSLTETSAK
jgi:hypothetical protein